MKTHLRNALRVATSWPLFFWSVVAILSLGVGANIAVFTALRGLLIDPVPYRDPDTLVVFRRLDHFGRSVLAASDIAELEELRGLARVAGCSAPSVPVLRSRPSVLAAPIEVTLGFFELFGVEPVLGRTLVRSDFQGPQRSAVLSFQLWQSMFAGDSTVVGRIVTLGHNRWTIVGVMPRSFQPRCFEVDGPVAWVPHVPAISRVNAFGLMLMGRLTSGVSLVQVNAELDALSRFWASDRGDDRLAAHMLEPIGASRAATARPGLMLLQSVAILLLLVACANIAGALLLNGFERRTEFALRVAIGATPWQLVRQVVGEMGAVAVLGVALGTGLALVVTKSLGSLAAPVLTGLAPEMGMRDLLAALALGGAALVLFGSLPALVAARGDAISSSAPRTRPRSTHRLRALFLVLQVSVTVILLTGATVLLRSYRNAMSSPVGFRSDGLLTTEIYLQSANGAVAFQQLARSLATALSDVRVLDEFAFSDASPFGGGSSNVRLEVLAPGESATVQRSFGLSHVSANYFSLLHIPLVRGRTFSSDMPEAVVSQAFASTFRGREVLGALVRTPSRWLRVVGVVGDVKDTWLTTSSDPMLYAPITFAASSAVSVTARSLRPAEASAEMRKTIERVDPNGPSVAIESLNGIVWRSEARRRFYLAVAGTFAIVALVVSALGIFSAVARVVASRSKDIAIRVALGARRSEVVRLVLVESLRPVGIGTTAGVAAGFGLVRALISHPFLQTLVYKAGSTDVSTYAAAVTVVLLTAVCACLLPLRRALCLDPARTLAE